MKCEEKQDLVGNNKVNLKTFASSRQGLNAQNTSLHARKWQEESRKHLNKMTTW